MFLDMLAMIGPQISAELIARLQVDLGQTGHALTGAVAASAAGPLNWAALRAQSHILIGLASTVGYEALTDLAHALNACAQGPGLDPKRAVEWAQNAAVLIPFAIADLDRMARLVP